MDFWISPVEHALYVSIKAQRERERERDGESREGEKHLQSERFERVSKHLQSERFERVSRVSRRDQKHV